MLFRQPVRLFHYGRTLFAGEKSALAALRKKTGYTFANCKKALEMHNNDLAKAENWLREQAQAQGWAKATKLEGRNTSQGLIGVLIQKNIGAMIEVNCETDFVARNEHFRKFVATASKACVDYMNTVDGNNVTKVSSHLSIS
jgi:elongation factor Ts